MDFVSSVERIASSSTCSSIPHFTYQFNFVRFPSPPPIILFPKCPYRRYSSPITHAKKTTKNKGSPPLEPILKNPPIDELQADEPEEGFEEVEAEAEEYAEDFGDEMLKDDEALEDDFEVDDTKVYVGDGGGGGGISLAGTWWDKKALTIAEDVSKSFDGDLKIYAFKTTANLIIRVRIEKLSTKYGSPTMTDIEAFSSAYQEYMDDAELAGELPANLSLEVSSPGLERVVRVPEELERFKEKPMYVRYTVSDTASTSSPRESDGVFRLVSFDLESCHCTWGIADVKINRNQAGKGRPLSKKQREWRLQTPFESLLLVRLHSDF